MNEINEWKTTSELCVVTVMSRALFLRLNKALPVSNFIIYFLGIALLAYISIRNNSFLKHFIECFCSYEICISNFMRHLALLLSISILYFLLNILHRLRNLLSGFGRLNCGCANRRKWSCAFSLKIYLEFYTNRNFSDFFRAVENKNRVTRFCFGSLINAF